MTACVTYGSFRGSCVVPAHDGTSVHTSQRWQQCMLGRMAICIAWKSSVLFPLSDIVTLPLLQSRLLPTFEGNGRACGHGIQITDCFFLFLMRWNSYNTYLIDLKWTIHWHLLHFSVMQLSPLSSSRTFPLPPKKTPSLLAATPHFLYLDPNLLFCFYAFAHIIIL